MPEIEQDEILSYVNSQIYILENLCKAMGYSFVCDILAEARCTIKEGTVIHVEKEAEEVRNE